MKSREEYQASIFAKRDALLAKRRKHIRQAVSGAAAAVLLTASFVAVPNLTEKLPQNPETTAAANKDFITQQQTDYDSHSEKEEAVDSFSENTTVTFVYKLTSGETTQAAASETKKDPDTDETGVDSAVPFEVMPPSVTKPKEDASKKAETHSETRHSYGEISEAAFGYLSASQQSECISKDNPSVIPVTSESKNIYLVTFHTDSKESYQVTLKQNNLELVGIKILNAKQIQNDYEGTTHKDGYKGE